MQLISFDSYIILLCADVQVFNLPLMEFGLFPIFFCNVLSLITLHICLPIVFIILPLG